MMSGKQEQHDRMKQMIDASQEAMCGALKRLVRIRSVEGAPEPGKPYGEGPAACLEEALRIASELGFSTYNMDGQCGYAEMGEGDGMVAVLGHLDVVPEADGWIHPAYDPVMRDGRMYGRGTIDDKGPVVSALYAMKAVRDAGIPLTRRVRLIFGCNEETGAADMKYYLAHGGEIPEAGFTPDGEYPLINGEKGIINEVYEKPLRGAGGEVRLLSLRGGVAGNVVPDHAEALIEIPGDLELPEAEKITVREILPEDGTRSELTGDRRTVRVEAAGRSAHGSTPEKGENAIGRLFRYLDRLPFGGDAGEAIHFLAEKPGMETGGQAFGCSLEDSVSGRFTFNLGVAEGGRDHIRVRLNYRYPVTFTEQDCGPAVRRTFENAGFHCTYSLHKPKLYVPESAPLVRTLLAVYREATGDLSAPKSIGGGTYAKAIPNIVAFGPIFPGDPVVEHLPDEYIRLDRLVQNTEIYAAAIAALAAAPAKRADDREDNDR